MDSIAGMRLFTGVVDAGSFSAAGRLLGIAPSSVSRRIGELEDRLGVRLFHRTTRKLSLTDAGEVYFERARDIVQAVEEADLAVAETRAEPTGTLRVSVPSSVARRHMTPAAAAFQARYPAVSVAMSVSDRLVDLVGEGFDLAVRIGRLDDSGLIARKIGEARRLVCASPAYLDRAGTPVRPQDIADHACLTFRMRPGHNLWRFIGGDGGDGGSGERPVEVRAGGPFFSDDGEALVAAACAGLGVILVPEWLVGAEIGDGRLVQILADYDTDPATTPLHALYPPGPHVAPKIRAFVDFLAGRFGHDYAWRSGG